MIVIKEDILNAGFCTDGLKEWLRLNGFESTDLRYGIHEDLLLATGCELARQVVEAARRRVQQMNTEI